MTFTESRGNMEGHAAMTRSGLGMRPERGYGTGVASILMHRWQSSPRLAGIKPGSRDTISATSPFLDNRGRKGVAVACRQRGTRHMTSLPASPIARGTR